MGKKICMKVVLAPAGRDRNCQKCLKLVKGNVYRVELVTTQLIGTIGERRRLQNQGEIGKGNRK